MPQLCQAHGGTSSHACPSPVLQGSTDPVHSPGPHVSLLGQSALVSVTVQQGWAPVPHSPTLPRPRPPQIRPTCSPPSWPRLGLPIPREESNAQGWSCPRAPQAALLPLCQHRDPLQLLAPWSWGAAGSHSVMALSSLALIEKLLTACMVLIHLPQQLGFSSGFI